MQPQVTRPAQAARLDPATLIAACLCVAAPFFGAVGWLLAIGGIVLLRRASFGRGTKCLLGAVAIAPKLLFAGVRLLTAPRGLSFPIEPRNLGASSALWVWCVLFGALGALFVVQPLRARRKPDAQGKNDSRQRLLTVAVGLVMMVGAAVALLGLMDGFHRIDDAGGGRWALRHAARGEVAVFRAGDVAGIEAVERRSTRGGTSYAVSVALGDGRSYSVTTKSSAALEELRKFATTANLAPGKARIVRRGSGSWTNGAGFTLKDCIGVYAPADGSGRSGSTYEFRMEGERLAGKETMAGPNGGRVRELRNIKVSDTGSVEFEPAAYMEASRQEKEGTLSFSLGWSAQGETGRFVRGGLEIGGERYRKR